MTPVVNRPINHSGLDADWTGNYTDFTLAPSTSGDVNGLYGINPTDKITFPSTSDTVGVGLEPRHISLFANTFVGADGNDVSISPLVKNVTTLNETVGSAQSLPLSQMSYKWNYTLNPETNKTWLTSDVPNYQFGFVRTT